MRQIHHIDSNKHEYELEHIKILLSIRLGGAIKELTKLFNREIALGRRFGMDFESSERIAVDNLIVKRIIEHRPDVSQVDVSRILACRPSQKLLERLQPCPVHIFKR